MTPLYKDKDGNHHGSTCEVPELFINTVSTYPDEVKNGKYTYEEYAFQHLIKNPDDKVELTIKKTFKIYNQKEIG